MKSSLLLSQSYHSAVLSWAAAIINPHQHLVWIAIVHIPPLTPGCWCVSGPCYEARPVTLWWERDRHIWVCGPPRAVTGRFGLRVSMAESLPKHSSLFKPGLFLNEGVGKARDGTRDDNTVFFTLRETLQWYEPNGIWQMRMSDAISSSAQGEREGTVLMLM